MTYLGLCLSNFKEFYETINAATLTGAIDVIVVEQPDGEFLCSPFHVRFGKYCIVRRTENIIVEVEVNGEPVDIKMKLGRSGEAFFVEKLDESESRELAADLATSPIPEKYFDESKNEENVDNKLIDEETGYLLPKPRRNSIDLSKDAAKIEELTAGVTVENQVSDFSKRRYTDNTMERPNLKKKVLDEYTTQQLREELAANGDLLEQLNADNELSKELSAIVSCTNSPVIKLNTEQADCQAIENHIDEISTEIQAITDNSVAIEKDAGKITKNKKRRKRSQMKKRSNARRESMNNAMAADLSVNQDSTSLSSNVNIDEIDKKAFPSNNTNNKNIAQSFLDEENISTTVDSTAVATAATADGVDAAESASGSLSSSTSATPPDTKESVELVTSEMHSSATQMLVESDLHFFSDNDIDNSAGRSSTPIQSDSEIEMLRLKSGDKNTDEMWKWGELPQDVENDTIVSRVLSFMKRRHKAVKAVGKGIYLSELEQQDEKSCELYMIEPRKVEAKDDDGESGNGTSVPQSPSPEEGQTESFADFEQDPGAINFMDMSLCGISDKGEPSDNEFKRHRLSYKDVCNNPDLFASPNLVVRIEDKYYPWAAACSIIMTSIAFKKKLTDDAIDKLVEQSLAKAKEDIDNNRKQKNVGAKSTSGATEAGTGRRWWPFGGLAQSNEANRSKETKVVDESKTQNKVVDDQPAAVATQTSRPNSPDDASDKSEKSEKSEKSVTKSEDTASANVSADTSSMIENMADLDSQQNDATNKAANSNNNNTAADERCKKSLRLSSETIKKLNLKEGPNLVRFSVTTAYQGTNHCDCYIFRWKYNDKVVISDIDGTITKSDVLGHILPMVGNNWAQCGVAELFTKIANNGYKMLYLSARAIGQSRTTRDYLQSICQGDMRLPLGPVLLNPTSLISAFQREVFEKKPEKFKIPCLNSIRDLFKPNYPFYAGYGNRVNDVYAYSSVGISMERIFTINTKGELKHELTQTFQSSYLKMTDLVDHLFPPVNDFFTNDIEPDFSNFNYWRDPVIRDEDLENELESAAAHLKELNTSKSKKRRYLLKT